MTTASDGPVDEQHVYVELGTPAAPRLLRWSTWRAGGSSVDSYALPGPQGLVLIDPVAPTAALGDGLWQRLGGQPQATVLTNDMHERDAYAIRERNGVPVWAPAAGLPARGGVLDFSPDQAYEDGATLPGGLRAVQIAGRFAGDTVLVWDSPGGERVLFTGDTLNGAFNPENPRPHPRRSHRGLYVGAGSPYIKGLRVDALKATLRPLVAQRVDLICGAHGQPWRDDPRGTLTRLLDLDWEPFLAAGQHPVVT